MTQPLSLVPSQKSGAPLPPKNDFARITVEHFLKSLIRTAVQDADRGKSPRRPESLKGLFKTVPIWLRKVTLQHLDVGHCARYLAELQSQHPGGAMAHPRRVRNEFSTNARFRQFQRALDRAVTRKIIKQNPAREVTIPTPEGTRRPEGISRDQVFRIEEMKRLLHYMAINHKPGVYVCFCVMALTGMQASEVVALRRRDIDFEHVEEGTTCPRPRIHVCRSEASGKILLHRRGGRWVDVTPGLKDIVDQWLARRPKSPNAWLFPSDSRTNQCLRYTDLSREWHHALQKMEPSRRLPLTSLRDTYAVQLLERRENVVYLSLQLGYALVTHLEHRYDHWLIRHSSGVLAQLHQGLAPAVPTLPSPSPTPVGLLNTLAS